MRDNHHMIQHARLLICLAILAIAGCASQPRSSVTVRAGPPARTAAKAVLPESSSTLARLNNEAAILQPLAQSDLTRRFLAATGALPQIAPRTAYVDEITREYFSPASRAALPELRRSQLAETQIDEYRYYYTKYGSPLAYLRALEFATDAQFNDVSGKRILDFGYGSIGHLRLLASLGASVTGVDADSYLAALYAQASDQGAVLSASGTSRRARGSITLVHGAWPKESKIIERVGRDYDLIISKNTLKRGYIKPERKVTDKKQLINLGVSDQVFLGAIFTTLAPGGKLVIYNIHPKAASATAKYNPMADGRSPFSREQFEKAGLKVVMIDADDNAMVRKMGRLLKWDQNQKGETVDDLDSNLFALVTVVAKPR
jgi:SAM-dependent methyltransferase